MKKEHIFNLIAEGEHQKLDFKFEISDARKIARSFAAFANSVGGKLLIGVNDQGKIVGIRSEEEKYMARKAVERHCKPAVNFRTKEWAIDGKQILEITIPKGEEAPYFARNDENQWRVYVRVGDKNILADKITVKALKRKYSSQGTYFTYSENEKYLLKYLENNLAVTLDQFSEMLDISKHKAEVILINFMALDIISADLSQSPVTYSLTADESES